MSCHIITFEYHLFLSYVLVVISLACTVYLFDVSPFEKPISHVLYLPIYDGIQFDPI